MAMEEDPQMKTQLQDITERMSLLLTSYDGPSDLLSQRLALKREKENDKMKGTLFEVLTDFNQILNERENILASIKAWFDVSSKMLRGGEVGEDSDSAWGVIELEMSNLMAMLEGFRNSSRDISDLERRLLKVVFKDTNIGDLDRVRNKIKFNSILKKNRPKLPSLVENECVEAEGSEEEINSEVDVDAILRKYPKQSTAQVQMSAVEIQTDLMEENLVEFQETFVVKKQSRKKATRKINVESQTEDSLDVSNSNDIETGKSLAYLPNRSQSCLEVDLTEIIADSNASQLEPGTKEESSPSRTRSGRKPKHSRPARRLIPSSQQRNSTQSDSIETPLNPSSLTLKRSPGVSPLPLPYPLSQSNRYEMTLLAGGQPPNLSFMQREQIKHENIELYVKKCPLKKYGLLTPLSASSPKRNGAVRALGDIHLDSVQPAHVFKQEEEKSGWGSGLVEIMKDMYVK